MPDAEFEMLYSGAKEMLRVIDSMNTEGLKDMLNAMYDELPELNRGKKNNLSFLGIAECNLIWYNKKV